MGMTIRRLYTSVVLFICILSDFAQANPIAIGAGTSGPEVFALTSEAIILGILLGMMGFDAVRIILVWIGATYLTYLGFMLIFGLICAAMDSAIPLIPGEITVIYIEGKIIQKFSCMEYFSLKRAGPLSYARSLGLSLIINISSIFAAVLFLMLEELL